MVVAAGAMLRPDGGAAQRTICPCGLSHNLPGQPNLGQPILLGMSESPFAHNKPRSSSVCVRLSSKGMRYLIVDSVEESTTGGGYALKTRYTREPADDGGIDGMRLPLWRECAAEVSRFHIIAPIVVLDQGALLTLAIHVAGDEVYFVADGGEVSHPSHITVLTDRIDHPDFPDLRQPIAGIEDPLDAFELYEHGPAIICNREAQTKQERTIRAERRAFDVQGKIIAVYEIFPLFHLFSAEAACRFNEQLVALLCQRDSSAAVRLKRVVDQTVQHEALAEYFDVNRRTVPRVFHVGFTKAGDESSFLGSRRPLLLPKWEPNAYTQPS